MRDVVARALRIRAATPKWRFPAFWPFGTAMKDLSHIYLNTLVPMVVEQTNRGERAAGL